MTSSYPPDDDSPESPLSQEAVTPRGGFMARPGLKAPPRHAVVVRVGDAPQTEHIPRFRSSIPPPPPAPEPDLPAVSQRITLRALPTPVSSRATASPPKVEPAPVIDSLPPPSTAPLSDAPFVSSISEQSNGRASQGPVRSRWTIVLAAAAGLVLGLASVAARVYAPSVAAQPPGAPTLSAQPVAPSAEAKPDSAPPAVRATPSSTAESELGPGERKPPRAPATSAKRSIF